MLASVSEFNWRRFLRSRVLTTEGGIAAVGLGRLLGGEHDSTLLSGVKAPSGASPDWIIVVVCLCLLKLKLKLKLLLFLVLALVLVLCCGVVAR